MKTYEKPVLMALSLGGNDRLCGDCANYELKLSENPSGYPAYEIDAMFGNYPKDGILTRDEVVGVFGLEWGCNKKFYIVGDGDVYCRYTSFGTLIAWS